MNALSLLLVVSCVFLLLVIYHVFVFFWVSFGLILVLADLPEERKKLCYFSDRLGWCRLPAYRCCQGLQQVVEIPRSCLDKTDIYISDYTLGA